MTFDEDLNRRASLVRKQFRLKVFREFIIIFAIVVGLMALGFLLIFLRFGVK